MMPRELPEDMPPDIQAAIRAAQEAQAHAHELEVEQRLIVLSHAWLFCTCRPWPEPGNVTPPQTGCIVHGTVMVTLDGRVF
jgi:hypothetical protein